jgi:hypothetical protein
VSVQHIDDTLIPVHRDWNGWQAAEVRLGDLREIHWLQPQGAPRPLVHAYVSCTSLMNGTIPHDCGAANTPHQLLVCVLKKHIFPSVHRELARRADAQGARAITHDSVPLSQAPLFRNGAARRLMS